MRAEIKKTEETAEYYFEEGCHILEIANDDGDNVSIARARVEPGTATKAHKLVNTGERYVIISGRGRVEIGEDIRGEVYAGDVVRIPPGMRQRIVNIGNDDLIFYVICTPRFVRGCYVPIHDDGRPVAAEESKQERGSL